MTPDISIYPNSVSLRDYNFCIHVSYLKLFRIFSLFFSISSWIIGHAGKRENWIFIKNKICERDDVSFLIIDISINIL